MRAFIANNIYLNPCLDCKTITNIVSTPSSTRTNSPDIDNYEVSNFEKFINKNRRYTNQGYEYTNGNLQWILSKPVYVVNTDYYYNGYQIKIYYNLYENFDVKLGLYDNNMVFYDFYM